jgi:hypothetical protein
MAVVAAVVNVRLVAQPDPDVMEAEMEDFRLREATAGSAEVVVALAESSSAERAVTASSSFVTRRRVRAFH